MSKYHDRTLALLGPEGELEEQPAPELTAWAQANEITLPASYLEWARLDRNNLLRKYSNDDWFYLDNPDLVTTPSGMRALFFHSENQNNFNMYVALDSGDDPPVLYQEANNPRWLTYCERFSDYIFARIFDWQYLLVFDADDPENKDIAYTGDIELQNDRCISILRERFSQAVTTQYLVNDARIEEYRFWKSLRERMTVAVGADRRALITITGELDLVLALEAELLELLSDDIVPRNG